jgi:uncharacterized Ntn-hydrolase superfamily protein
VPAVSQLGTQLLALIGKGLDTEEALEKAARRDPENIARSLAALSRRGFIERKWANGQMRWRLTSTPE